jgi:hypothetical protein
MGGVCPHHIVLEGEEGPCIFQEAHPGLHKAEVKVWTECNCSLCVQIGPDDATRETLLSLTVEWPDRVPVKEAAAGGG